MGSIPTEVKRFFLYLVWLPDSFTRDNAQWVIHGFISTLIYTSELILCFTIFKNRFCMTIIIGLVHYPNHTFLQNYYSLKVRFKT